MRFNFRPQLRRDCADESRVERELAEDCADFAECDARLVDLEINNVVIAIDLVTQAGDRIELVVEREHFFEFAHTGRVNFQLQHGAAYKHAELYASGLSRLQSSRRWDKNARMKLCLRDIAAVGFALFLAGCGSPIPEGIQQARIETAARIANEPQGDYFIGRRYFKPEFKFWGYIRRPGQPWSTAQLVMLNEKKKLAPDRERVDFGFDNNYEYKLRGYFSGEKVYEPASNGIYPEFVLTGYDLISTNPPPIFRSQMSERARAATGRFVIEKPE